MKAEAPHALPSVQESVMEQAEASWEQESTAGRMIGWHVDLLCACLPQLMNGRGKALLVHHFFPELANPLIINRSNIDQFNF
jgi:ribonucleotide reductase beta subunit family protein with ferritin-like domain